MNKNKQTRCLHLCSVTDTERGEVLCRDCGIVLCEKIVDPSQKNHGTSHEEFLTTSQTGPGISLTMYDKGLYTVIGTNKDSSGISLSNRTKSTFSRLRTWDKRSKSDSKFRNLGSAFTLLHGMKGKLGIPDTVLEKTAYIYRKAVVKKLTRGRSIPPLVAASLYVTCRESGIPRSLSEIAKAANVRRKILSRTVRILVRSLELTPQQYDEAAFIAQISNNIGISEKTKRDAFSILKEVKKIAISSGKNPLAQASASVYLACLRNNEHVSQTKLSEVAGVSCVTIRNTTFDIKKVLKL